MNFESSDSVRKPCAIVVPNGECFARSGSTWIHCGSSIALAKRSIRSCVTSTQGETPTSCPILLSSSRTFNSAAIASPGLDLPSILAARSQAPRHAFPDRTRNRPAHGRVAHAQVFLAVDDHARFEEHRGHGRRAADRKV